MKMIFRNGIGYDVHRFSEEEGRPCILGGVQIPHSKGLEGHSDADVLSHAIADAILGAMALPDIGYYFPPGDESCKNICSLHILTRAVQEIQKSGAELINIDSTLIAEAPKILPHVESMKERLSKALNLPKNRIGIKATTNEKMGFLGRKEGIAALATATVQMSLPE